MERRYDLDWVRIFAFGLLVLYHVGMYYVTWDWHVKSPYAGPTLEPLMLSTSPWRLSLLFLVSGVATAFMLDKRPEGFFRKRSWRLLLPLVFGMLVIVTPQAYYEVVEKLPGGFHDGYLSFWGRYLQADPGFCRDGECLDVPTWNHLWFVAYLWVYTLVLCAILKFAPTAVSGLRSRLPGLLAGWRVVWVPALLLVVARLALLDIFESTHALVDDWYNHVQYFGIFVLGFLMARAEPLLSGMERLRWPVLAVALASYAFLAWYFSVFTDDVPPPDALRMFQRVIWGLFQWTAIVAILGFARRWSPGDSPARRYLTQAVFPIYILHQTLIVVLAHNAKPWDLKPAVEAPLLTFATLVLCFAGFEMARRVRWLRPLLGLRMERQANATRPAVPASPEARR